MGKETALGQFNQRSTYSFYARRFQKRQMTLLTWLSFLRIQDLRSIKAVRRTLMKLTECLNFCIKNRYELSFENLSLLS